MAPPDALPLLLHATLTRGAGAGPAAALRADLRKSILLQEGCLEAALCVLHHNSVVRVVEKVLGGPLNGAGGSPGPDALRCERILYAPTRSGIRRRAGAVFQLTSRSMVSSP